MLTAKIYSWDGKLIDQGIWEGGKHFHTKYPDQSIRIYSDSHSDDSTRRYDHIEGVQYFQEFQDNGNGWEVVYDSREGVDRSVEYDLPAWFVHGGSVPNIQVKMNKDGEVEQIHKGYYR